ADSDFDSDGLESLQTTSAEICSERRPEETRATGESTAESRWTVAVSDHMSWTGMSFGRDERLYRTAKYYSGAAGWKRSGALLSSASGLPR
ncbi:MAG: hypothetical protein ACK56I_04715, partial [bacterium]